MNVRERIETLAICRSPGRIFQRDIASRLLHEDGTAVEDTQGFSGIQQDPAGFGDFNKKTGVIEW